MRSSSDGHISARRQGQADATGADGQFEGRAVAGQPSQALDGNRFVTSCGGGILVVVLGDGTGEAGGGVEAFHGICYLITTMVRAYLSCRV
jgi:hypothetical protein